eukprot:CAMPEP_0201285986 /NCGR_PEP_ID=MMETSP1317-20130820/114126_1 /ASSEMBLY_ACC=CAM_ASM_000770 /TAXON_ID=187299 /ORGANISM="Undescribed Undescribed, Strain Undescribed" /LENGTH=259 /DNA_ID=CAMNT_0047612339 /DNA_START=251 /DNA_END=1030 /DNA_ORIENTATION=-
MANSPLLDIKFWFRQEVEQTDFENPTHDIVVVLTVHCIPTCPNRSHDHWHVLVVPGHVSLELQVAEFDGSGAVLQIVLVESDPDHNVVLFGFNDKLWDFFFLDDFRLVDQLLLLLRLFVLEQIVVHILQSPGGHFVDLVPADLQDAVSRKSGKFLQLPAFVLFPEDVPQVDVPHHSADFLQTLHTLVRVLDEPVPQHGDVRIELVFVVHIGRLDALQELVPLFHLVVLLQHHSAVHFQVVVPLHQLCLLDSQSRKFLRP